MLTPVVLPPGLASEATKPDPTRSSAMARIGMVFAACCAARTFGSPAAKMTSTLPLTSLGGVCRKVIDAQAIAVRIAEEVLTLDEALPTQGFEKRGVPRRATRTELQAADAIGATRLLRHRHYRPHSSAAQTRDERAPVRSTNRHQFSSP
jgi:hypothetical protein